MHYQAFYERQPPGAYRIQPTSNNPAIECVIYVRAFTRTVLTSGWVGLSPTMPTPERVDFPDEYLILQQASTLVVHVSNNRFPAQLKTVELYRRDNVRQHSFMNKIMLIK